MSVTPFPSLSLKGRLAIAAVLAICLPSKAQNPAPQNPEVKIIHGYQTHQSVDLGGHIVEHSGSDAMYDTLVNLHSGPRILNYSLLMDAEDLTKAPVFDHLSTSNFGYGGDPYNVSLLNISKGRIYDFEGSFRRSRQYFDYNLLANSFIPPASTPFVPILDSPHLFNTVRRMTDAKLTVAPLSKVNAHLGYSQNVTEGPSYSTVHVGAEALLLQNFRQSTDVWNFGVQWKPIPATSVSYEQFFTHYKGNTSWQLAGLNYALSNGTPVSLGVNLSSVWKTPCAAPFNPDGTVNPTCNGFIGYTRVDPIRALYPSERLYFQSSSIHHLTMNGQFMYMGTTTHVPNFNEDFNGLDSRAANRREVMAGSANVRRINVNGDFAATLQINHNVALSDIFDFWDFRQPGTGIFTQTNYAGTSMLQPPGAATTTTTSVYNAFNQKSEANTVNAIFDVTPRAHLSIGYRYRYRFINDTDGDSLPIHENWGLFGAAFNPTPQFRINFDFNAMYADAAFTRISPRQLQQYIVRTTYKPHPWLSFVGTINIFESRDNVATVNHLQHNRNFSFGSSFSRSEHWSVDLDYSYSSLFSSTLMCFASTPAPPTAITGPPVCVNAGTPLQTNGYYSAPTQFGSIGIMLAPTKRLRFNAGYRMNATNGTATFINISEVPGALQSQYQTPYGHVVFEVASGWFWKADYNYYSYGEGTPIGPAPRSFRGNVYTLSVGHNF